MYTQDEKFQLVIFVILFPLQMTQIRLQYEDKIKGLMPSSVHQVRLLCIYNSYDWPR